MKREVGNAQFDPVPEGRRESEVEFERLYQQHFEAIYAYMTRRAAVGDTADLVADVFATAWRRHADIPRAPEDRLWLFGVARRIVSQHDRGRFRRERLKVRLRASALVTPEPPSGSDLEERALVLIEALKPKDRELVKLILWDGLSHAEVATVLGCSVNAVRIRWHRALKRLRRDIGVGTDRPMQSTLTFTRPSTEEA